MQLTALFHEAGFAPYEYYRRRPIFVKKQKGHHMRRYHLGMLCLLFGVCCWIAPLSADSPNSAETTDAETAEETAPEVIAIGPSTRVVLRLAEEVDVPAQEAGTLLEILVRDGDVVTEGAIVARIDDSAARLTREKTAADLKMAERLAHEDSAIEQARRALSEEKQKLTATRISHNIVEKQATNELRIQAAEKAKKVAESELGRAQKAKATFDKAVAQSQFDELKLKAEQSGLEAEQARLEKEIHELEVKASIEETLSQELAVERAELDITKAEVAREVAGLQAEIKHRELDLSDLSVEKRRVTSPLDGVVVEQYKHRGEWVEPGERVLRILRLNRLWAEGFIKVEDLSLCVSGAEVMVTVTLGKGENAEEIEVPGKIVFVGREVDPSNQDVQVRAEIINDDLVLLPGMKGEMQIELRKPLTAAK